MAQQYRYYLTTFDNPFDPVDQQDSWMLYDKLNNYDSNEKLASLAKTSDELIDNVNQEDMRMAILKIMALDPNNIYTMIKKPMPNL